MAVKKTVVVDEVMDACVRKVWASLVESGWDANYSTALNILLIAGVQHIMGTHIAFTKTLIINYLTSEGPVVGLNDVSELNKKFKELNIFKAGVKG